MRCRTPSIFPTLLTLLACAKRGWGSGQSTAGIAPAANTAAAALVSSNPHIRLDPRIEYQAAQIIRDALKDLDPAGKATFEKNAQEYIDDLNQVDHDIVAAAAGLKNKDFNRIRGACDYLAQSFRVKQIATMDEVRGHIYINVAWLIEKNTGVKEFILQSGTLQSVA